MALNYPKLALPPAEETIAFRAVEQVLRTDPVLSRVVRSWQTWLGEPLDTQDPTWAMCPYLGLSPGGLGAGWENEGQHRAPMAVGIRLAVVGTDCDQILNFYASVRRALWPLDPARFAAVRELVQSAGISRPTLSDPAYGCTGASANDCMLIAAGVLDLLLLIDTP